MAGSAEICGWLRWEYKLPLFASDRSKWYEQISFWQRDIQWLVINNNRYTHNIIKDIYTSVCKDMFDGPSAAARSSNWELATDGLTQVDKESGHYRSDPASDSLAEGEQVSSVQCSPVKCSPAFEFPSSCPDIWRRSRSHRSSLRGRRPNWEQATMGMAERRCVSGTQ